MLTILTGPDRQAGLSQLIDTICARAAEGIGEQILIVPEQYSFEAERALCRRGGDTISRFAEVLSFTRLASRVFSIYGGVSEEYLDEGGRLLCLYLAAERVKTQIKFYAASLLRPEFLLQLGKMMEEFLTCCVTPQQLLTAAGQMTGQQAQCACPTVPRTHNTAKRPRPLAAGAFAVCVSAVPGDGGDRNVGTPRQPLPYCTAALWE